MNSQTSRITIESGTPKLFRQRFSLSVIKGQDSGKSLISAKASVTVGTDPNNDLVITDPSVSRHHLRVEVAPNGFLISDLESTNGTLVGALRLGQALTVDQLELRLGETLLRFSPLEEEEEIPLLADDHFGAVIGRSLAMRELFQQLESVASQDVTVVIEGETGTGKELMAQALHERSPRRGGPLITVDCGAIPSSLIESELFGHARGAFTGAGQSRPGALEAANGGTVFLDEIGELDLSMQPRLLRALESRQVKRLGETQYRKVDIRVIAATNRDLKRCVNQGTFRADLFYRLSVVHLHIPPLRSRPEDVALLVERLLPQITARFGLQKSPQLDPRTIQELTTYPWPGNVRELRNLLERLATFSSGAGDFDLLRELGPSPVRNELSLEDLSALPFTEAKAKWLATFDLGYLTRLLARCDNNVAEAARQSGINRVHLFRLIKKYGLRP